MKNEDKPINPIPEHFDKYKNENIGLTKREYFSGLALQGLLANPNGVININGQWVRSPEQFAEMSILCAKELLKQLENSNTKNQDDRN